jgi:Ca-activated chloride channel family protein
MTQLAERGQTALYDGLYVALSEIGRYARTPPGFRSGVLVALTDGADTVSMLGYDQLLEQARRQGVAIYVVRMQGKALARELTKREIAAAHQAMDTLAGETGGRVLVEERGELAALCGDIARELASRYTLGYVPANTRRDGRYRRITVRVEGRPDLAARTRAGYFMSSGCNCSRSDR